MRRPPVACTTALTAFNVLCLLDFRSLANNVLCGVKGAFGTYTLEGINTLCKALESTSTLTSLKYSSQLESLPTVNSL